MVATFLGDGFAAGRDEGGDHCGTRRDESQRNSSVGSPTTVTGGGRDARKRRGGEATYWQLKSEIGHD